MNHRRDSLVRGETYHTEIVCTARRENILGEGPVWDASTGRLYWVDIEQKLLEWLRLDGMVGTWQLDWRATAAAPRTQGGLLLATERGFATFDTDSGASTIRYHPEPERVTNRPNDGHTDATGRFWLGTMDDEKHRRSGAVYRLDADWSCVRVMDGLGIPNTLISTPDGRVLYLADSKDQVLYACDIDPKSGTLRNSRVFADTKDQNCTPDGSALDEEGFLWNAQWGGWRVVRYAPDGSVDRIVPMPVQQPTSCAFGGDDLSTLFVTSARAGLSFDVLAAQPLAGSVFSFEPGVRGIPTTPFAG